MFDVFDFGVQQFRFKVFLLSFNFGYDGLVFLQFQSNDINLIFPVFNIPPRADSTVLETFRKLLLEIEFQDFTRIGRIVGLDDGT